METTNDKDTRRHYDEDFCQRCSDFAVLGLRPPQIAERLGLTGRTRENFLFDCTNPLHPLHILITQAYIHGEEDIEAALTTMAVSGDTDALELAFKVRREKKYEQLINDLFGI